MARGTPAPTGANAAGQLGIGTLVQQLSPVMMTNVWGIAPIEALAAGVSQSFVIAGVCLVGVGVGMDGCARGVFMREGECILHTLHFV